jgi:cytochrome c oxidase subunit 3
LSSEAHAAPAHQFDDLGQQREAAALGMWVFLVTEVMFFGGLFAGYTIYRSLYPQGFIEGSHHLDILLGSVNTIVLIGSSLTVVLSVHAAQTGKQKHIVRFLLITILLGCVFLGIKAAEYGHKFHDGLVPGSHFLPTGPHAREMEMFYYFYFAMTGVHALHMIVGVGLMSVIAWMAHKGRFSRECHSPIEVSGLYWHFVDIIWIFLFPLLYLIGRH